MADKAVKDRDGGPTLAAPASSEATVPSSSKTARNQARKARAKRAKECAQAPQAAPASMECDVEVKSSTPLAPPEEKSQPPSSATARSASSSSAATPAVSAAAAPTPSAPSPASCSGSGPSSSPAPSALAQGADKEETDPGVHIFFPPWAKEGGTIKARVRHPVSGQIEVRAFRAPPGAIPGETILINRSDLLDYEAAVKAGLLEPCHEDDMTVETPTTVCGDQRGPKREKRGKMEAGLVTPCRGGPGSGNRAGDGTARRASGKGFKGRRHEPLGLERRFAEADEGGAGPGHRSGDSEYEAAERDYRDLHMDLYHETLDWRRR